jgi:hypothetical protein
MIFENMYKILTYFVRFNLQEEILRYLGDLLMSRHMGLPLCITFPLPQIKITEVYLANQVLASWHLSHVRRPRPAAAPDAVPETSLKFEGSPFNDSAKVKE